jgi:hypothetical protein
MMLGSTTLPKATLGAISPSAKQVIHDYDWSDECDVTDMGSGPTTFTVTGWTDGETDRLAVMAACEAARKVETNLYFPSTFSATDDRHFRVFTGPMQPGPVNASFWGYSFNCIAVVPYIYDATTGARVT